MVAPAPPLNRPPRRPSSLVLRQLLVSPVSPTQPPARTIPPNQPTPNANPAPPHPTTPHPPNPPRFARPTGLLIAGPVVGLVLAGGAAIAASADPSVSGVAGQVAVSTGKVAVSVGKAAVEADKKYSFMEKSKAAASAAFEKAKKIDEQHHLSQKAASAASTAYSAAKEFDQKHHVVEKVGAGVCSGLEKVGKIIDQQSSGGEGGAATGAKK